MATSAQHSGKRGGAGSAAPATDAEVPVVGLREPCPCGSGRRYKACHGKAAAHAGQRLVSRPFEGLTGEADWVALREIVPSATVPLALIGEAAADRDVTLVSVLPLAWPALVRQDGSVLLGVQGPGGSGDVSRDLAAALLEALAAEPGQPVGRAGLPGPGPRLQDLLDPAAPFEVSLHDDFAYWLDPSTDVTDEITESLQKAGEGVVPTVRLTSVDGAYWVRIGPKEHLRWVLPHDEAKLLDAFARLHVAGDDVLGPDTRFIGSFRAHGLLVPVWDLAPGTEAGAVEEPAVAYGARLAEALADDAPLTSAQRSARAGLLNRQLTLR